MKRFTFGTLYASLLALCSAIPGLAAVAPYFDLSVGLDQVAKEHGPGRKLPDGPDGALRVEYKVSWLGFKQQAVASYEQPKGAKTISRITLRIPQGVTRPAMLKALQAHLGLPPDRAVLAPGSVNATWIWCGLRYRLTGKAGARTVVLERAIYAVGTAGLVNGVILQDALANLTGKGRKDLIYLVGIPFDKGAAWMKSLYLVVVDRRQNASPNRGYALGFGGLEVSELLVRDFTGDGKKEVLVTAPTGGSGGLNQYALVSLLGGVMKPLVESAKLSQGPAFDVRFRDGFKAQVTCARPAGKWNLDLRPYRKEYIREHVYNPAGKLLTHTTGQVDGVGLMTVRGAGSRPTLVATQAIWGTYHANGIGKATVRWRWRGGKLRIVGVKVANLKQ